MPLPLVCNCRCIDFCAIAKKTEAVARNATKLVHNYRDAANCCSGLQAVEGREAVRQTCSLFYPPRTALPVDKSQICHCPTQALMRFCACQAAMPPRKSRPSGKRWNGSKAVRYRNGMDWTRKRKRQEVKVAAGKLKSCAGQSLTAKINAG